jgi:hypothetical protein
MRVACIIVAPEGNHEIARLPPPPLTPGLANLRRPVLIGTALWAIVFVVLLVTGGHRDWQWIALDGWILGIIGMLVMWWQRSASRRGARGAQRGL